MAGELVPLVMIPRFSTYCGNDVFSTIAMDVTEYQAAILNVWRNTGVSTTTLTLQFQESTDGVVWSNCTTVPAAPHTPAAGTETQYEVTLKKRWFRMTAQPNSASSVVTCWAVGFLEQRER